MAGLYLHVPFCKKACHYCDFHFTQSLKQIDEMVDALCLELEMQSEFLGKDSIYTIYFGGGTPSLLEHQHLKKIMKVIQYEYDLASNIEITLEANPDDLSPERLEAFYSNGINRLSIGIQSFHNENLEWMNRQHTGDEAIEAVLNARQAGFENISIDLIYAVPAVDHSIWEADLKQAIRLRPEHISSYCLTIEPRTAFGKWLEKGRIQEIDEDFAAEQFEILLDTMYRHGYDQYEISNFAQPGYESRHNSAYWKDEKYLGIGPSAHSYNGKFRKANVANNAKYLKGMEEGKIPFEVITLSREDQINEYILTSLRTKWGCSLDLLKEKYGVDLLMEHRDYLNKISLQDLIYEDERHLILTDSGKLLADKLASDLFIEAEE
ncbi:radical SAM family heme chaperone HemW [Roseivirga sp.]|uniref:radical SAM family heme chaperone HemW n=1 Tax=Roseivirga sp. TaxID=1964215 RepID=UPI003B530506